MARSSVGGSLTEVRESVKRLRGEGERFMGRIRRDTQTFARQTRAEVEADVRKVRDELRGRADCSIKDLETRGRRLVDSFESSSTGGRYRPQGAGPRRGRGAPEARQARRAVEQRIEQLEQQLRETLQDTAP